MDEWGVSGGSVGSGADSRNSSNAAATRPQESKRRDESEAACARRDEEEEEAVREGWGGGGMLKSVWEDASVRSRRAMNAWEELVSSALQSSDHLRIVWWGGGVTLWGGGDGDSDAAGEAGEAGGPQFTCFTGTKVQILTPEEQVRRERRGRMWQ